MDARWRRPAGCRAQRSGPLSSASPSRDDAALVIVFMLSFVGCSSRSRSSCSGSPSGFYVYSTKIVELTRQQPPQAAQAAALGSLTLLLLMVAVPIQRWLTTRRSYTTVTDG